MKVSSKRQKNKSILASIMVWLLICDGTIVHAQTPPAKGDGTDQEGEDQARVFGAAHLVDQNTVLANSVDTAVQARQGGDGIAAAVVAGGTSSPPVSASGQNSPGRAGPTLSPQASDGNGGPNSNSNPSGGDSNTGNNAGADTGGAGSTGSGAGTGTGSSGATGGTTGGSSSSSGLTTDQKIGIGVGSAIAIGALIGAGAGAYNYKRKQRRSGDITHPQSKRNKGGAGSSKKNNNPFPSGSKKQHTGSSSGGNQGSSTQHHSHDQPDRQQQPNRSPPKTRSNSQKRPKKEPPKKKPNQLQGQPLSKLPVGNSQLGTIHQEDQDSSQTQQIVIHLNQHGNGHDNQGGNDLIHQKGRKDGQSDDEPPQKKGKTSRKDSLSRGSSRIKSNDDQEAGSSATHPGVSRKRSKSFSGRISPTPKPRTVGLKDNKQQKTASKDNNQPSGSKSSQSLENPEDIQTQAGQQENTKTDNSQTGATSSTIINPGGTTQEPSMLQAGGNDMIIVKQPDFASHPPPVSLDFPQDDKGSVEKKETRQ